MYTLSQNVCNTLGIRWSYAIHTLAIRQLYASCMLNTLLNRPAYANMSIYVADTLQIRTCRYVADTYVQIRCRYVADTLQIRCRYVADTQQIRQKYVTHALLIRYHGHDCGITLQRIVLAYASVSQVMHRLYAFQARCHTLAYVEAENYLQSCLKIVSIFRRMVYAKHMLSTLEVRYAQVDDAGHTLEIRWHEGIPYSQRIDSA